MGANQTSELERNREVGEYTVPPSLLPAGFVRLDTYLRETWGLSRDEITQLLHPISHHLNGDTIAHIQSAVVSGAAPLLTRFRSEITAALFGAWPKSAKEDEGMLSSLPLSEVAELLRTAFPVVRVAVTAYVEALLPRIAEIETKAINSLIDTLKGHEGHTLARCESRKARLCLMLEEAIEHIVQAATADVENNESAALANPYGVVRLIAQNLERGEDKALYDHRVPRREFLNAARGLIETSLNPFNMLQPQGGILLKLIMSPQESTDSKLLQALNLDNNVAGSSSGGEPECQAHAIVQAVSKVLYGVPTNTKCTVSSPMSFISADRRVTLEMTANLKYVLTTLKASGDEHSENGYYVILSEDSILLAARSTNGMFSREVFIMRMAECGAMQLRGVNLYNRYPSKVE